MISILYFIKIRINIIIINFENFLSFIVKDYFYLYLTIIDFRYFRQKNFGIINILIELDMKNLKFY